MKRFSFTLPTLALALMLVFSLHAADKKICLNMIVKDETHVIKRCLESAKPIIDYWVIVDTGSTDGTQEMIKEFMKGIPGELHERPWVNFGHNRNEALDLARDKGDYILLLDADEKLVYAPGFKLPPLEKDFYYIQTDHEGLKYKRVELFNTKLDWKWIGVVHEVIHSPQAKTFETLEGIHIFAKTEGNRSKDPQKYHKDAALLEKALLDEPGNTRTVFYLAQSYRDADVPEKALENYKKRSTMGGWDQEVFFSLLQIGHLKQRLKKPNEEILKAYEIAYLYRPSRAEPLYFMAKILNENKEFDKAFALAKQGLSIKESDDILFVDKWIYDYGMLMEYSLAAYWTEQFPEALLATQLMMTKSNLPDIFHRAGQHNLEWINKKLAESASRYANSLLDGKAEHVRIVEMPSASNP